MKLLLLALLGALAGAAALWIREGGPAGDDETDSLAELYASRPKWIDDLIRYYEAGELEERSRTVAKMREIGLI